MAKIMIVDDEQDLIEMLQLMLKKEGFKTETALDGQEFLDKVDTFKPDLVTLDVMMPGLTTGEILKKIKDKKNKPKIILLTVVRYSDEEIQKIFQIENIVSYITKPFELDELIQAIHKHLRKDK